MSKIIYVGNLSPWTTPEKMRKLFKQSRGHRSTRHEGGVGGRSILLNEVLPRGDQVICQRGYW
jgi:hypothetical protein